jgi:methylated-DNA-protein-cysteine methyltransferase-like protein
MSRPEGEAFGGGWAHVHRVVGRIPAGRVASYGQIAAMAGMPGAARQVGYALHALEPESGVPWHRVVNAQGRISLRGPSEVTLLQRARLEAEGVVFDPAGRIDLARFAWKPRVTAPRHMKKKALDPSEAAKRRKRDGAARGREETRKSRGSKA